MPDDASAEDIFRTSVVIDGMNNAGLTGDYLRKMRDSGCTAAMVPVSITDTFIGAVERILALREVVAANADVAGIVETVRDIQDLKQDGRVGLILALEDSRQLEKDLRKVRLFHDLGIRRMQLVYTTLNDAGCGRADRLDAGLSAFGVALVKEIQSRNILLDLCHAGPATLNDALAVASRPAAWSHTNAKAIFDHPNNMSDEQLDLVAANGGVVGISAIPYAVGGPSGSVDDVLDHIDHVVKRIGVEHVGIGLAIFENHPISFYERFASLPREIYGAIPWTWPRGIASVSDLPTLASSLLQRGYDGSQVQAILGGNYLRLLASAWESAA